MTSNQWPMSKCVFLDLFLILDEIEFIFTFFSLSLFLWVLFDSKFISGDQSQIKNCFYYCCYCFWFFVFVVLAVFTNWRVASRLFLLLCRFCGCCCYYYYYHYYCFFFWIVVVELLCIMNLSILSLASN